MENAAKALLMAGGILIALLIIGAIVLLFSNLQDYQNKTDISEKQAQIAQFNNQFEPFNKNNLTLMELKSVYNKIQSNNARYPEYNIEHNINEGLVSPFAVTENIFNYFTGKFTEIDERDKINRVFNCTGIEYKNEDGRISKIIFQAVK